MRLNLRPESRVVLVWAMVLAASLLALSLLWRVPMMLWDHLDLVPMYLAWQHGQLASSDFWSIHGGHVHSAAYAVLLATTYVSNGQTWLDGAVSWFLLLVYAAIVWRLLQRTTSGEATLLLSLAVASFLLYPGHLANLQWGWQVAVFLCLAGVAASIWLLTRPGLRVWHNLAALVTGGIAYLSFGHGIAVLPAALVVLALHPDLPTRQRLTYALPWLLAGVALLLTPHVSAVQAGPALQPIELGLYVSNYLGSGVARYATALAPWLAGASLFAVLALLPGNLDRRTDLPWLALLVFSLSAAVLVALARAPAFGADHAFVTRYVSFSSLYWLAWLVLMHLLASRRSIQPRWLTPVFALVLVSAALNALHLIKQAHRLGQHTQAIAQTIARDHPKLGDPLLAEIYFDQPAIAAERLQQLRQWGFAPFAGREDESHAQARSATVSAPTIDADGPCDVPDCPRP